MLSLAKHWEEYMSYLVSSPDQKAVWEPKPQWPNIVRVVLHCSCYGKNTASYSCMSCEFRLLVALAQIVRVCISFYNNWSATKTTLACWDSSAGHEQFGSQTLPSGPRPHRKGLGTKLGHEWTCPNLGLIPRPSRKWVVLACDYTNFDPGSCCGTMQMGIIWNLLVPLFFELVGCADRIHASNCNCCQVFQPVNQRYCKCSQGVKYLYRTGSLPV